MTRSMRSRPAIRLLGAIVAAALAGCGGGSDGSTSTQRTVAETPQRPAQIPKSWKPYTDRGRGFSMGVPAGWKLNGRGASVLLRSPDRLVALSLSADRNDAAFGMPPDKFARRALSSLAGYKQRLKAGPPRPIGATPLDTAAVRAEGVAKGSGVPQKVEFVVLRRDHLVNFTSVIAANAKQTPGAEIDLARRILRSVRDEPPRSAAQRSGRSG